VIHLIGAGLANWKAAVRMALAVVASLTLGACGTTAETTTTTAATTTTTTINGATVASDMQALVSDLTSADVIPASKTTLSLFGSCTADDFNHLQTEVNASQWDQAGYYAADVKADLATYASSWPSGLPVAYSTLRGDVTRLTEALPKNTATLHPSCSSGL
jgi:hypothetical protein